MQKVIDRATDALVAHTSALGSSPECYGLALHAVTDDVAARVPPAVQVAPRVVVTAR